MKESKRDGNRKSRDDSKKRIPKLGYYFIVTDTKETEKNYFNGLRKSISSELQDNLVIKVKKSSTVNLVDEAQEMLSVNAQYGQPWIVFDRDEVKDFDDIIKKAKEKNIHVGWSNNCIEIWFSAYFGSMPVSYNSVECCKNFSSIFKKITGHDYDKADEEIYKLLNKFGDEKKAIAIANSKIAEHKNNNKLKPSEQMPATTLHILVEEIKNKINLKR